MTESDHEKQPRRRRRRRRAQSVVDNRDKHLSLDDSFDPNRWSKLIEQRIRKAVLLNEQGKPPHRAMQVRHVHNRQHAIPFRQQCIERLVDDMQYMDRKIKSEWQKQAAAKDMETACLYRKMEAQCQKNERDLELLNNRSLVREILAEYLKKSTPKGQLRRITKLEEELSQLRKEHEELVKRVGQNEITTIQYKKEHDHEIIQLKKHITDYQSEIHLYKNTMDESITDLQMKLNQLHIKQELLREKQGEHGIEIQNLTLQRETLNNLAQQIQRIIDARRSDLDKLDTFNQKLDELKASLERIDDALEPLSRISSLEEEIKKIRTSLIDPRTIEELQSSLERLEQDMKGQKGELEQVNTRLNRIHSLYEELMHIVDDIKLNDLTNIRQSLQSIKDDLHNKSLEINEIRASADEGLRQISELGHSLEMIGKQLSELEVKMLDIESIKNRLSILENRPAPDPNDPRVDQILANQRRMEERLKYLIELETRLNGLDDEINKIKNILAELMKANEPNDGKSVVPKGTSFEGYLNDFKQQILESVSALRKELLEQINAAKALIAVLKAQLEQWLAGQQPNLPQTLSKLVRHAEPLQPIDLLGNNWI